MAGSRQNGSAVAGRQQPALFLKFAELYYKRTTIPTLVRFCFAAGTNGYIYLPLILQRLHGKENTQRRFEWHLVSL
jgi:hypothetical protein